MLAIADGTPDGDIDDALVQGPVRAQNVSTSERRQLARVVPAQSTRAMQLYASDDTAELMYERAEPVFNLNNSRASVSFLFNEKRDNTITGSLMYDAEPEFFSGLTLSFGTKLYAGLLSIENADVVGLAASIEAAYKLPVRQFPLKLSASVSYAPDILTFGQADRIIDWNVRSGLALTKNIDGFVGLRFLQFDTRPGDRELDKKIHVGIRWALDK